jgi:cytochrome o ubiquinol oxidase subunit 2
MRGEGHCRGAKTTKRLIAGVAAAFPLTGCAFGGPDDFGAAGPVSGTIRELLITAAGVMLIVVIPVYLLTIGFAWRYRASNRSARYAPDWAYSPRIDFVIWAVPALVIAVLGTLVWVYTHRLDPYRPLQGDGPPLLIQAVAMDWKWLFIYPEHKVAAVNELVIPRGRPVTIALTSDTVMNAFFVPDLAGQIYAMAGMETRLNFRADRDGAYVGRNTQYSGSGFADQSFTLRAVAVQDYDDWIDLLRQSPRALDAEAFAALAAPSSKVPVAYYADVPEDLFASIIARFRLPAAHAGHE